MGNGHGARDQDPIAMLLLVFMGFVVFEWLTNAAFSPFPASWQGNAVCNPNSVICFGSVATNFSKLITITTPLLIFAIPLAIAMFGFYLLKELSGTDPRGYFETEILRTRALITVGDQMELNRLSAVESAAQTRAEKNAAIKQYNMKVDEINARRRKATGKPLQQKDISAAVPKDQTTPQDRETARYNAEIEEENAQKIAKEKQKDKDE